MLRFMSAGPLEFILLGLAIYRMARMMATERGPFDIFYNWRGWVFKHFKHNPTTGRQSWIDEGFNCVLCLSFWLSLFTGWLLSPLDLVSYLLVSLALAGFAAVLFRVTG